ncbi:MAG: ATP-binding protein [Deltaproteobacteria bacterium]|nr:ATP-binding protein [Deltaproteobacteria bacterium]
MKKLPIGVSSFKKIRRENRYYVDKSYFVKSLADNGIYYFLSRPRRFGKSLFLDTLKQAFLAEKEYFKGLFLEKNWDWTQKHPVIHISFGGGVIETREILNKSIYALIKENARHYAVEITEETLHFQFKELIRKLYDQYKQPVVILIDEYDKPILDNITKTDIALQIREGLKNLYSVIKDCDEFLKFVFLTGVNKFSKVSLFSGLNNLTDITLDSRYATLCGYTHAELINTFKDRLDGVDLEKIRLWYDGYNFLGEHVYNPYDILLYLDSRVYKNYWFETATPSFLIKLIQEKQYYLPQIENLEVTEEILESFDVDRIVLETLLFQTGYLTITKIDYTMPGERIFFLNYPNLEVKTSLNNYLLNYLLDFSVKKAKTQRAIYNALKNNEIDSLKDVFHSLFASIPYNWYVNNDMDKYEGYYASVFYCYFAALGIDVKPEDPTSHGRIDLTVKLNRNIYLIEFKVVELDKNKGNALAQIKTGKYYEKYMALPGSDYEIFLIGVEFSRDERNIVNFEWERMGN